MAVYDYGLTSEEFYDLTPRQFHALTLRHKEAHERVEMLMGITTAAQVNHSFCTPKKPYCPADFMPSQLVKREQKAPKPKRWTRQGFADQIRAALTSLPAGQVVFKTAEEAKKEG